MEYVLQISRRSPPLLQITTTRTIFAMRDIWGPPILFVASSRHSDFWYLRHAKSLQFVRLKARMWHQKLGHRSVTFPAWCCASLNYTHSGHETIVFDDVDWCVLSRAWLNRFRSCLLWLFLIACDIGRAKWLLSILRRFIYLYLLSKSDSKHMLRNSIQKHSLFAHDNPDDFGWILRNNGCISKFASPYFGVNLALESRPWLLVFEKCSAANCLSS